MGYFSENMPPEVGEIVFGHVKGFMKWPAVVKEKSNRGRFVSVGTREYIFFY